MRRKLALAMALSMVLTSVPVNTLTGFAEEAVVVEEVVMEDSVEEAAYAAAEVPQDFDVQILEEESVMEFELEEEVAEELTEVSDAEELGAAFEFEEFTIEGIEEVEEPVDLEQFVEVQEEVQEVLEAAEDEEDEDAPNMTIQDGMNFIDLTNAIEVNETNFPETITVGEEGYVVYKFVPTEPSRHSFRITDQDGDVVPYGYVYKESPDEDLWCWTNANADAQDGSLGAFTIPAKEEEIYYIVLAPRTEATFCIEMKSLYISILETGDPLPVEQGGSVILQPVCGPDADKLSYAWRDLSNLLPIPEAENQSSYEVKNITEDCQYDCTIYDPEGNELAIVNFRITIDMSGTLVYDEDRYTLNALSGDEVTLDPKVSTTVGTLSYRWFEVDGDCEEDEDYYKDEILDAAGKPTLVLNGLSADDYFHYHCEVSNEYVSKPVDIHFEVYVESGLEVWVSREAPLDIEPGESISLEVGAESKRTGTITFKWFKDYNWSTQSGTEIEGSVDTDDTSTLTMVPEKPGSIVCQVSNGTETETVEFTVRYKSGLAENLENHILFGELGDEITLSVPVVSNYPETLQYQWFKRTGNDLEGYDFIDIPGATQNTLTVTLSDSDERYRLWFRDKYNENYCDIQVCLNQKLTVSAENTVISVKEGESTVLKVHAVTDPAYEEISYQWLDNYQPVGDGTDTLTVSNVTSPTIYRCMVKDKYHTEEVVFYVGVEGDFDNSALDIAHAVEIHAGETKDAVLPSRDTSMYFKFVPEYSGVYRVYSSGDSTDSYVDLFGAKGNWLYGEGGEDGNFCLRYEFEAGKTYYIVASVCDYVYDDVESYPITYPVTVEYEGGCLECDFALAKEVIPATCTKDGVWYEECVKCHTINRYPISATGHKYVEDKVEETENVKRTYQVCTKCGDVKVSLKETENAPGAITKAESAIKGLEEGTSTVAEAVEAVTAIDNEVLINREELEPGSTEMNMVTVLEEKLLQGSTGITGTIEKTEVKADASDSSVISENVAVTGAAVTVASVLKTATEKEPDADSTYKAELEIKKDTTVDEEPGVFNIDISLNIIATDKDGETTTFADDVQPAAPLYITIPVPEMFRGSTFELRHNGVKVNYYENDNQTISFYAASLSPWSLVMTECATEDAHEYVEDTEKSVAATCKGPGAKVSVCKFCKDEITEPVASVAHKTVHTAAAAATCAAAGNKEYWTCSVCEKYFADAEAKTEITKASTVVAATGTHTWTTIVDQAAGCGTAGSQHQECTVCKSKQAAEPIPATGTHTWTTVVDQAATCAAAGSQHQECTVCKAQQAAQAIPATGNHEGVTERIEPTYFADGAAITTCKVCKAQLKTETLGKLTYTVAKEADKLTLGLNKSVKASKLISGLVAGDYITNVTTSQPKYVEVKKSGNDWNIKGKKVTSKKTTSDITITLASGASAKITFSVQKSAVKAKTLKVTNVSKNKVTLTVGDQMNLETLVKPVTAGDATFSTSNKKIVTVSKTGKIKAMKAGTATITVKAGGKSVKVKVTVKKAAPTSFTLSKTTLSLKVKKSATLKAKFKPSGSEGKVTFTSSAPKIASVNKTTGKVTAKKKGTAVITATVKSATGEVLKQTCTVTVKK